MAQASTPAPSALTFAVGTPLEEVEHRMIQETLAYTTGDKSLAAQLLGIAPAPSTGSSAKTPEADDNLSH